MLEYRQIGFSTTKIKKLLNSAVLEDVSFGRIEIKSIPVGFDKIEIDAEFTPIELHIEEDASYDAILDSKFGKINIPDDIKVFFRKKESNSQRIEGKKEGKGKKGVVKIRNEHAKILIK